ncbi:TPA: helix-turn-helix domain-containing protein [Klebsiella aerogenes]|nr:helix-turn-helix domain-containing protein [Klebsiella aerogenes]
MNFAELHSYYKSLEIDSHLFDIMDKGELLEYPLGHRLLVENNFAYFVIKGSLSISMPGSDLNIGNAIERMPIGLMERFCPLANFEYNCVTPASIIKLSWQDFDDIFISAPSGRVIELMTILSYMTIFSLDLHFERKQSNSYQIIKPMLSRYLYRARNHTNESEGIAEFIIRRTNLSRTHVFRILAGLKEGGYITVKRGRLTSINKNLPKEY